MRNKAKMRGTDALTPVVNRMLTAIDGKTSLERLLASDAYNPNQPRGEKGTPHAGRWVSAGGGSGPATSPKAKKESKPWASASKHRPRQEEKRELVARTASLLKRTGGEHESPKLVEEAKSLIGKAAAAAEREKPFWEQSGHPANAHGSKVKMDPIPERDDPKSPSINQQMKQLLGKAKPAEKRTFRKLLMKVLFGKDGTIMSARDSAFARDMLKAVK
jgi:hypothetical protein